MSYPNIIKVYKASDGWRWRLVARNGYIVADSGQKYSARWRAVRAAKAVAAAGIEVANDA
ncbi:hypothetical protein BST28_18590 [Mycolicibacter kumamotonensis]|uniref:DUF1508 domain-containing protein n=1 Tax=Mycolicibacter kumamotonensis TaxID=354243 RepID=A0A1X0DXU1_9MYCO|nr:DUF1508 domain-containing protein [Mycolicibacter kumamotonensis]ORA77274.1 hypothetical protein BST28_18590 [Mycolicibacter kumamotonensis]